MQFKLSFWNYSFICCFFFNQTEIKIPQIPYWVYSHRIELNKLSLKHHRPWLLSDHYAFREAPLVYIPAICFNLLVCAANTGAWLTGAQTPFILNPFVLSMLTTISSNWVSDPSRLKMDIFRTKQKVFLVRYFFCQVIGECSIFTWIYRKLRWFEHKMVDSQLLHMHSKFFGPVLSLESIVKSISFDYLSVIDVTKPHLADGAQAHT